MREDIEFFFFGGCYRHVNGCSLNVCVRCWFQVLYSRVYSGFFSQWMVDGSIGCHADQGIESNVVTRWRGAPLVSEGESLQKGGRSDIF